MRPAPSAVVFPARRLMFPAAIPRGATVVASSLRLFAADLAEHALFSKRILIDVSTKLFRDGYIQFIVDRDDKIRK